MTATTSEHNKLDTLVAALAKDLRSAVAAIEADPLPSTRGNYGKYLDIMSVVSKGDRAVAGVIRLALIEAGANPRSVADAFHASFSR
jgi:hypothetical protein